MTIFLVVLLCVFLSPLHAQQYTFYSGISSEKTADLGLQLRLPFFEARLFGESDFSAKDSTKIALKNWSLQFGDSDSCQVSAGNISFSGVYSRFNNPVSTVPSATKSFGVSESGLDVSKPSFSSSRVGSTSFAGSLRLSSFDFFVLSRFERDGEVEQAKTVSFPLGVGASFTYPKPQYRRGAPLEFSVVLFTGHTVLESKESDSWYLDYTYFAQTSVHYLISEFTVKTRRFEAFSSNGISEHPLGDLYFFTRNEISWNFHFFTLNGFFSYIDNGYIPANGNPIHKSLHAYINPQLLIPLNKEKSRHLRIGTLASAEYEHSAIKRSLAVFVSDLKAALSLLGKFVSIHTDYELRELEPLQQNPFSIETLQRAKLTVEFKNSPIRPSLFLSAAGRYEMYPYFYVTPEQESQKAVFVEASVSFSPIYALYFHIDTEFEIKETEIIPTVEGEIEYSFRGEKSIMDVQLSVEYKSENEYEFSVSTKWGVL